MERAIAIGAEARALRLRDILDIHRVLMLATSTPQFAGELRDRQNWIGGNAWNPGRADFVPPPPDQVKGLMQDLVRFLNRVDLPALAQAGIAHAQFETIHPFADGNGRVGRAIQQLPAHPILTLATGQKLLRRSKQAANEGIAALARGGVLHPVNLAKRNRAWEARDVFDLVDGVERELAIPAAAKALAPDASPVGPQRSRWKHMPTNRSPGRSAS